VRKPQIGHRVGRMPISSRFVVRSTILLLGVGFLTLVGIVLATIWLGERASYSFNEVNEAREMRASAVELRAALQTAESSQRGFLVTGNEIYLAPYDTAKAQTLRQLANVKRRIERDPGAEVMVGRLTAVVGQKINEMDSSIALKAALRDKDAVAEIQTNRGKALMDEANLFLSGIIRRTDDRLLAAVGEQRANTAWLRWVSILGGLVIVLVVGGVTVLTLRYAREVAQTRDEVRAFNASLEERVKLRTADLARARDRAEVLVQEVNHRVANSLALVNSMVQLQARSLNDQAAKDALAETQARIYAIASVHKRLYTAKDVRVVELDEYLAAILDHLAVTMRKQGSGASLHYSIEPLRLPTDTSINLGVVVTELVTNAFKYAYPSGSGEVRVRLSSLPERKVELLVEDDGVGAEENVVKGTGLGTRIVHAMASSMEAKIEYSRRSPGTAARMVFPLKEAA
jgi:two-component sensor histidine kinase/CHASE3 domain sensor protein